MSKQESCGQRIEEELECLLDRIDQIQMDPDADEPCELETHDEFLESLLAIDRIQTIRVCLSYGGPSSFLKFEVQGGEFVAIYYVFQDWFDGAERRLTDKDFETVASLFGFLLDE